MNALLRTALPLLTLAGTCCAQLVIPSGTKVTCRLEQSISSATAQEGQAVNLAVTEDVRVNDVVVIPQGATVFGTVMLAKERGRMGRSGKLDFSIDKVRAADNDFVPLRYTPHKKSGEGKGVTTGVLTGAAAVVFWPAAPFFLMMKGKDVTVNKGITVDVFTDADHTMKSPVMTRLPNPSAAPPALVSQPAAMYAQTVSTGGAEVAGALVPVTIDADVDGAEVEIDGSFVGNTPSTRRLAPGSHKITVRDGGRQWERNLMVQPGDNLTIKAKLNDAARPARRN